MIYAQGKLIAIGGAEKKGTEDNKDEHDFFSEGILKRILEETKKENPHLLVITSASEEQEEMGKKYLKAFQSLGCSNIHILNIHTPSEADKPVHLDLAKIADAVMMTGGDQSKLVDTIGETDFFRTIRNRFLKEENFVIAGTSAGAAAMPEHMIVAGDPSEAMIKGSVAIQKGFNLSDGILIDTHFVQRGRFGRLTEFLLNNKGVIGLGLGEDTAVVFTKGKFLETIGSGLVVVIDIGEVTRTNYDIAEAGDPIFAENIKVHILAKGTFFDLQEKKLSTMELLSQ